MVKLTTLFEIDNGKLERQKEIEDLYVKCGFDLEPLFKEALSITLRNDTPKKYRGRGFMASTMNWTLIGVLKETYPDRMVKDTFKRDYFILDSNTRIYFKKLDKHFRPNNIPTNHVIEMNSMNLLFNDKLTTILYGGFRLREDKYWDDISCYLVEMKNMKRTNWVSNLSDLSILISNSEKTMPIFKAEIPNELIIKAKNHNKQTGENTQ